MSREVAEKLWEGEGRAGGKGVVGFGTFYLIYHAFSCSVFNGMDGLICLVEH